MTEHERLLNERIDNLEMTRQPAHERELRQWQRAAEVKQEWLDAIVEHLGMEKANSLQEILDGIDTAKADYAADVLREQSELDS